MVRFSFSIFLHSQPSTGNLTETLPVGWTREPAKGLSSEDQTLSNSGTLCQPLKDLTPDCLSIAGLLREFLICRLVPGEISVWGAVPEVAFQQGAGLTVLVIFTLRPTGALDNSTTGQGLVHTEGSIPGSGKAVHQDLHWEPEQAGWLSPHQEPQQAGWQSAGFHLPWVELQHHRNKAGTRKALQSQITGAGTRIKNGFWLVITSAGFTTGSTRTAKDLDNSIASSLANLSAHLSSRFFKSSDEGLLLLLGFFLLDLGEGLGELLRFFFFPAGVVSG